MNRKIFLLAGGFLFSIAGLLAGSSLTFATSPTCSPTTTTYDSGDTRYTVLSFTQTGAACTWTKPTGLTSLDYLIVAGGGGGGGRHGGGGGGGGLLSANAFDVTNISETSITVGAGGNGSPYLATNTSINGTSERTQRGGNSQAFGLSTTGGGPGAGKATAADFSGGSGGGSDSNSNNSVTRAGVSGQGSSGGAGVGGGGEVWSGGGGGGAGEVGGDASSPSNAYGVGGDGGSGTSSAITGTTLFYAAGGGGGTFSDSPGSGGAGGSSGVGGAGGNGVAGGNGMDGRGGGGGGAGHTGSIWAFKGGDGGDGIVIIRYIAPPSFSENTNAVLLVDPRSSSAAIPFVNLSASTSSRICFDLYTNNAKTTGLDLKDHRYADSSTFRLSRDDDASALTSVVQEDDSKHSKKGMRIQGTRTNVNALLKRSAPTDPGYIRIHKSDDGWVDGSVLEIRADYGVDNPCSSASSTEVTTQIMIKVVGIQVNQKNEVSVN